MKIYRNPNVKRPLYFVKMGPGGRSFKGEASKSQGYELELDGGKWEIRKAAYYDQTLREFPQVVDDRYDPKKVMENALKDICLVALGENEWYKNPFEDE